MGEPDNSAAQWQSVGSVADGSVREAERERELANRLTALVRDTPWFMEALRAVRELGLPSWCIGAGAVRNLVWDALHQAPVRSSLPDIDVAYFSNEDLSAEADAEYERRLALLRPDIPWEVTNQAGVHLWFESCFGHPVEAVHSLAAAVATWPEYATSVGICLHANDDIEVIAPHGLRDLFSIVVRRNPTRVSVETYRQRVEQKRYAERWPGVTIVMS
jgi:hypothetical protein